MTVPIIGSDENPYRISRANYVRVFARWLDSAGWRDHAPFEAMVGYALYTIDGTFIKYNEAVATWIAPDAAVEQDVTLANLDGWLRWIEVKRNPVTGEEAVWRR